MKHAAKVLISMTFAVAGCSGGAGVSTSSILGGASAGPGTPPAATEVVPSDPTSRAFHVGIVSARAVKCGYNFDAAKLKASYLASEVALGASNEEVAKIEQIYTVSFNGVTKATAAEPEYCSDGKTQAIKADLGKLLAGDYNPPPRKIAKQEGGVFSSLFDNDNTEKGPAFGTSDWWTKQSESVGGH